MRCSQFLHVALTGPALALAFANDTPDVKNPMFPVKSARREKEGEMRSPVRHPQILEGTKSPAAVDTALWRYLPSSSDPNVSEGGLELTRRVRKLAMGCGNNRNYTAPFDETDGGRRRLPLEDAHYHLQITCTATPRCPRYGCCGEPSRTALA